MRSISLFEKIELEYKGTVFQSAICLYDVDSDGDNELCICNTAGDLHVFKGIDSAKPWKVNKCSGPVVVLCGGTIRDCDEKLLCALDAEGKYTLYGVDNEGKEEFDEVTGVPNTDTPISPTPSLNSHPGELKVVHQQLLAPNARCAILEDIDNDGVVELIVGYTDRFVRIYKWQIEEDEQTTCNFSSTSKKMSINKSAPINDETRKSKATKNSFKKDNSCQENDLRKVALSFSLPAKECKDVSGLSIAKSHQEQATKQHPTHGAFVLLRQYPVFSQVGSLAIRQIDDLTELIVSQPNGCYCVVDTFTKNHNFSKLLQTSINPDPPVILTPQSFQPFQTKHSRNYCYTSTEVIGGIKRSDECMRVIGLCTLDGSFMVIEDTSLGNMHPKKSWLPTEHRWFSMSKFDVTNDGDDEIVLCSMNGMTYMIDKDQNIVSYNFNENVGAFCAGAYGPVEANNVSNNCLCYVTLNGKIHIYYNVWISAMNVKCVHGALITKLRQREDLKHILDGLKLPTGEIDHKKIQMLVKNTWSEKH